MTIRTFEEGKAVARTMEQEDHVLYMKEVDEAICMKDLLTANADLGSKVRQLQKQNKEDQLPCNILTLELLDQQTEANECPSFSLEELSIRQTDVSLIGLYPIDD